jgi:hypothetical protein
MKVYGAGGEEELKQTLTEYNRQVLAMRCPNMIFEIANLLAGTDVGKLKPEDIIVEHVTSMKENSYWKIVFNTGLLTIEYTCYARSSDKNIIKHRSLEIRNPIAEMTMKAEFEYFGEPKGRITTMNSFKGASSSYDQRRAREATESLLRKPPITLPPPKVSFVPGGPSYWECTCHQYNKGLKWCAHIKDYLESERDAADLKSIQLPKEDKYRSIYYPVAEGWFTFDLTMRPVSPTVMGLPDTDPMMYRLNYGSHMTLWMEEGTSGMQLVRQLIEIVEMSELYQTWLRRAMNRFPLFSRCNNKHHEPAESRSFNDSLELIEEAGMERAQQFVLANALNDHYRGRCIPCRGIQEGMKNDVPLDLGGGRGAISGPSTPLNPF